MDASPSDAAVPATCDDPCLLTPLSDVSALASDGTALYLAQGVAVKRLSLADGTVTTVSGNVPAAGRLIVDGATIYGSFPVGSTDTALFSLPTSGAPKPTYFGKKPMGYSFPTDLHHVQGKMFWAGHADGNVSIVGWSTPDGTASDFFGFVPGQSDDIGIDDGKIYFASGSDVKRRPGHDGARANRRSLLGHDHGRKIHLCGCAKRHLAPHAVNAVD